MSVAKNIEISSNSNESFEDAINQGIARAGKTVKNLRGAWIKEQKVKIENNRVTEYQVDMILTFVLDDEEKSETKSKKNDKPKSKKK